MNITEIQIGDYIRGSILNADSAEAWCKVLAINKHGGGGVYGDFTHDHLIYDSNDYNIKQYGM